MTAAAAAVQWGLRGSVFRSTVALGIVAAQAGAGVQKSLPWRAPVVMATLTIRPMSSGAAAAQKPDSGFWRVCGSGGGTSLLRAYLSPLAQQSILHCSDVRNPTGLRIQYLIKTKQKESVLIVALN